MPTFLCIIYTIRINCTNKITVLGRGVIHGKLYCLVFTRQYQVYGRLHFHTRALVTNFQVGHIGFKESSIPIALFAIKECG
jgi:hypothetical protein